MSVVLKAELFALSTAAKAYYQVHGGSLERGPLEVRNFWASVDYCLASDTSAEDTTDAVLTRLLEVGIAIITEDASSASIGVGAALYRAREVVRQQQARVGAVTRVNLHEALACSHTAEYIAADGVRYQVQEGVNFCVRRLAPGEMPDSFAALNLAPALAIAAGRGWLLDAEANDWMPVQRTTAAPVPAMEAR